MSENDLSLRAMFLRIEIDRMTEILFNSNYSDRYGYPPVPPDDFIRGEDCVCDIRGNLKARIPRKSGIYFLWFRGVVEYVGQSSNLNKRLRLHEHHVLIYLHRITFVLIDRPLLDWAESFYIGITRPTKNFGKNAAHRRYNGRADK